MADIARLEKVLDRVAGLPNYQEMTWFEREANLGQKDIWDQGEWLNYGDPGTLTITERGVIDVSGKSCKTAGCFAGWTVIMFAPSGTKIDGEIVTTPDGKAQEVDESAQELLDLDDEQAEMLFSGGNSLSELRFHLDAIREEEA